MNKKHKIFFVILCLCLFLLFLISSPKFSITTNETKFETLEKALEDYYIETIGYNGITIEDIDDELNMVLLYTEEKGKRLYGITNYNITKDGKFILGEIRDEMGLETQSQVPIEMSHIDNDIGLVHQVLLYSDEFEMKRVQLFLKNGDLIEKSASNNNVFIPIPSLDHTEPDFDNVESLIDSIDSIIIYDSQDKIIWSNRDTIRH